MLPASSADNQITDRKSFFLVLFLLINALVWLFMANYLLGEFITSLDLQEMEIIVRASYYASIIAFGVIGAFVSKKLNRLKFIFVWTLFCMLVSLLPIVFNNPTFVELEITAILFGGIAGIGVPFCLGYFADSTTITNRGLFSGLCFLFINIFGALFLIAPTGPDFFINWIILSVWRGFGLIVFIFKPVDDQSSRKKYVNSFKSIISEKAFYLYFIAWFMFMLIDRSEAPTLRFFLDDLRYDFFAPIIGSISALVAGILADRIGRKRVVMTGFVIYGIAYAFIGIVTGELAKYLFLISESISTGILWTAFIMILWGDLSEFGSREKYYVIGVLPFFLTLIIQLISGPIFMDIDNSFSLAALFLFVALLPLWLAPETLPEKKIELRRLKTFAEQARKEREKFERKNK